MTSSSFFQKVRSNVMTCGRSKICQYIVCYDKLKLAQLRYGNYANSLKQYYQRNFIILPNIDLVQLLYSQIKYQSKLVFLLITRIWGLSAIDINITISTVYQLLLKVWKGIFLVFKYGNFLLWIFLRFT